MPKLPSANDVRVWGRMNGSESVVPFPPLTQPAWSRIVQERGWRKDGRKRVGSLYIAAIVEGKGSRGMEAGVAGATPLSANAHGSLGGVGGGAVSNGWALLSAYRGACRNGG
jgi:hypothetical protein